MNNIFRLIILIPLILNGCGGITIIPQDQPPPALSDENMKGIAQTLIALIEKENTTRITAEDYISTSIGELIKLGTPAGYRLKLRYLEFGISLVEGLRLSRDEELRRRLIEHVQWSRRPKVRGEALLSLASFSDPAHKKYFKEALLDKDVGIRFAAVEAMQIWGQPEAIDLLKIAMGRDWSPLMQVYAAQALLSLGDSSGLDVLYQGLNNGSWVVKSMSARYLGDYGKPEDYMLLTSLLRRESKNDYFIAELSIAALKLISKKDEKVSYSPTAAGWRKNDEVTFTLGKDSVIEIEPLIIVPPRLRIPLSLQIAAEINNQLLNLIKNRLSGKLDPLDAEDPMIQDLNAMQTPSGFALKTRYTELSYLVTEGLAGTTDGIMQGELERLASQDPNPLVRASAIISLAYTRDERFIYLIQNGLTHANPIVRFGSMEAIEIGRYQAAIPSLISIANTDPCPAFQVYAMQVMARFGEPAAHNFLISQLTNPDWPARAMAFWYLGRFGEPQDFYAVLARLQVEDNPFVLAEIVIDLLRLAPIPQ